MRRFVQHYRPYHSEIRLPQALLVPEPEPCGPSVSGIEAATSLGDLAKAAHAAARAPVVEPEVRAALAAAVARCDRDVTDPAAGHALAALAWSLPRLRVPDGGLFSLAAEHCHKFAARGVISFLLGFSSLQVRAVAPFGCSGLF